MESGETSKKNQQKKTSITEGFVDGIEDPVGRGAQEPVLQEDHRSGRILSRLLLFALLAVLVAVLLVGALLVFATERYPVQFQDVSILRGHEMHLDRISAMGDDFRLSKQNRQFFFIGFVLLRVADSCNWIRYEIELTYGCHIEFGVGVLRLDFAN